MPYYPPPTSGTGSLPIPTKPGQVLFSIDGVALSVEMPLTNPTSKVAWMINDLGIMLVVG